MKIATGLALAVGLAASPIGFAAAERMIDKQVVVAAPIDEVWKAWTTREGVKSFFAPDAIVEPRSGGLFEMQMNPYAPPGMKGADDMRFLALQEPTMLSFTWNAPPHQPEIRAQRTVVIVRLRAIDAKNTEVTLHHVGWGDGEKWDATYAYFDRAWGNVLANLQKRFTTGPIDFTPFLEQLKAQSATKK
jgi:uncharacterized protein YndB with AHSA1/START domain